MNNLNTFNYNNTQVRTVIKDNDIWWVLKDVCDILEIRNHKDVSSKLDEDEKGVEKIDTLGGAQTLTIINEAGLYKTIFRSTKPEAKKFMHWVTHEVLPSIRRHGAYMTPQKIEEVLLNPDTIIQLAKHLRAEQEKVTLLQAKIDSDRPKVRFADAMADTDSTITISALAKLLKSCGYNIGRNRLFAVLRERGFLIKNSTLPTQKSLNMNLFKVTEVIINQASGKSIVKLCTKVTGHGQCFFLQFFGIS